MQGSSIIIDTIAPNIQLDGNNNTIVPTNSSYTDAGATASDASYTSDLTLTGANSDFDNTKAGNYVFTYTAEDEAGNTDTIIRNVIVRDIPPIGINSFEVDSDNTNTLYAKVGDDIFFDLNVNNTIDFNNVVADVSGANVYNNESGTSNNVLYVDAKVLNTTVIESNATFTITIANENGTTLTVTNDDLTSPNVFIDTIPPRITPDGGSADYFIVNGTDPIILNVTVIDGDPNYSGNYTLTTNATVNANMNGSVYNYTYTADADSAGNPGPSLSRIITIIDAPLIGITSLSITSSPGNSNFANEGKTITLRLQTDSNNLGNFTGTLLGRDIIKNDVNSGTVEFTETVSPSDTNGNVTFSIVVTNSSGGRVSFTESDLDTGSFVTIDTVAPTIALNGENNTIVALGADYTDLGATAYDLSYGNSQVTTTDRVNVNQLDHYTLHYTAPTDAAGNIGQTITRIVEVLDAPPITITNLAIESSNSNSSYAKAGDTLDIDLTINYTITSYTITIFNTTTSVASYNSPIISLAETVPSDQVEEYTKFSITVIDANGLPNTISQDDLTSPDNNVFVDTIPPSLTLISGPANYSIVNGSANPTIRNVTAHDGDPNYSFSIAYSTFTETDLQGSNIQLDGNNNTIVPTNSSYTDAGATASDASYTSDLTLTGANSDFDNTKAGNYVFTYTAEDEAGNTDTIIRNVIVRDIPPIGINSFEVDSDNTNTLYAKVGDDIFFDLNVNNTIDFNNVVADVSGANVYNNESGTSNNVLYVDAKVLNTTVIESNATFTITIANENGTTLTVTNDDLTSPNVFIDTIPPRITPDGGSADYFIVNGTDPIILNVTVIDGDPNYSGNYTLTTNATVNANMNGSVYNYTYTADADSAGNPGPSLSRIITIIDAPLIGITSLSITSSPGNSNFANEGKTITLRLQTDSNNLGNFTGTLLGRDIIKNDVNSGTVEFTETVSPSDTNGNVTFSIVVTNSSGGRVSFTESDLDTGSFVTIDTVAPTIALNGENNTIVALGADYTDLGATAYDLSYGNSQVTTTDRVNVNQLDHYTLHYTAPTDAAGNIGQTITRIVEVLDAPPITITNLAIESSNSNSSYAKAGDTLDIDLTINYTITSYTITIFNTTTSVASYNSPIISLAETVPSDQVEEYTKFSITVIDANGLPNTISQDDLTSPDNNVFVDTIPPSLTLISGPANYSIVNGSANPTIRNVTAHDGDPNYSGNYTLITPNGIVNADINGSVYNYTYTADTDTAGNPGASVSRIITIVDALPIGVTSLSITSNSGNNFANADKIITLQLQTDSDDLHDITGTLLGREFSSTTSGGGATFTTTVLSGDTNGNVTFSIEALNSSDGRVAISESDITDGSFVTIDTVLPVITLNGENNTIVAVGVDYTDPSATVADQDNPSYAGTITARPATLDTSSAGNKTITYTAPADAAGNVPV